MAGIDKILEGASELASGGLRRVMGSNGAINPIEGLTNMANRMAGSNARPFMERGLHGMARDMVQNGTGIGAAAKNAFTKADGTSVAWGTVAGSYIGASVGYRALSGGGAYRDKNGNTNLAGIPFV